MKKILSFIFLAAFFSSVALAQSGGMVNGTRGFPVPNDGTTGTTLNSTAIINSAGNAIKAGTSNTAVPTYIVVGGAATTGNAVLASKGTIAPCTMDATNASGVGGAFVINSTTTAGDCHVQTSAPAAGVWIIGYLDASSTTAAATALVDVEGNFAPGSSAAADICDTATTTDTVTNTVTTAQSFATTCVIPASTFTANKMVNVVMAYGEASGTTSQTLTIAGTIGGSAFYTQNTAIPTITASSTADWLLHCQLSATAAPGAAVAVTIGCNVGGNSNTVIRSTVQQLSLATNGSLTVAFTAAWGGTTGVNTANLLSLRVY